MGILIFLVILGTMVCLMNKAGGSAAFGRWAQVYACFVPEGTESGARLIEHADKALYYVKRNSRNAYYIIRE